MIESNHNDQIHYFEDKDTRISTLVLKLCVLSAEYIACTSWE